jgi:hypothetical protein
MTMRHALFIDGAWMDAGGDSYIALVTVDKMGIDIKGYTDGISDVARFTLEEFAAIVEMVSRVQEKGEAAP